jgi:hypothetical protein
VVIFLRHGSDPLPKFLEQQSENVLALGSGPAQALGVVMEDGAGNAAFEAAPRSMIEFMHGDFDSVSLRFGRALDRVILQMGAKKLH